MSAQAPAASQYAGKQHDYFDGARIDIVRLLPGNQRASILEIGCGTGATGKAAKAQGKCGRYIGIELMSEPAAIARQHIDTVFEGDIERIDWSSLPDTIDAVILSEVLEHLIDPWDVVRRVHDRLRPGGRVYASSPNIASWRIIKMLFRNRFDYEECGPMDRTHLRWFTSSSYKQLFETAGFRTLSIGPLSVAGPKWRLANLLSFGMTSHLSNSQIMYVGEKSAD